MKNKTEDFLLTVNSICNEEKPMIVDFSDFSKDDPISDSQLYELLNILSARGLIRLVYIDENEREVCLQMLSLGSAEAKNIVDRRKAEEEEELRKQAEIDAQEKLRLEEEQRAQIELQEQTQEVADSNEVFFIPTPEVTTEAEKPAEENKSETPVKAETKKIVKKPAEKKVSLPKNAVVPANNKKGMIAISKKELMKEVGKVAFWCAFLGTLLGGAIVGLITLLV